MSTSDRNEENSALQDGRRQPRQLRTQRLEAFSDGVLAIAITLLVLNLAVQPGSGGLLSRFLEGWPAYLAYLVSFSTIGAVWLGHTLITEYLERADAILVRLNLLLLLVVAFLPFPTRLLALNLKENDAERVAVTIYGITLFLTTGLLSALWRYSLWAGLVRQGVDDRELTSLTRRLTPSLVGYVFLLALGLVAPVLAVVGYLLVALFILTPLRRPRRRIGANK